MWQGGGLYILGTAMLTNTSVFDNQASGVCSHCYSLNFHPAPRCVERVLTCYLKCAHMFRSLAGDSASKVGAR